MNKEKTKGYVKIFEDGCSCTQDVGPASDCEECLEAFATAVDRLYNSPSSDFTIPKGNPGTEYLFWDECGEWFVGWWEPEDSRFKWAIVDADGGEYLNPLYWVHLPDAPNNRPNG